jgi:hypothetical protein
MNQALLVQSGGDDLVHEVCEGFREYVEALVHVSPRAVKERPDQLE